MPRTRNVTREQWEAAVSPTADPTASAIRSLSSSQHQRNTSQSSLASASASVLPVKDRCSSVSVGSSLKENRGYEEGEDENVEVDENRAPAPVRKGKGKEKEKAPVRGRKRKQRPLQDITDLVVLHGNRPSEVGGGSKRRKRVRLGYREESPTPLNLASSVKRTPVHNPRFPSSLPPSSPPPPTSFEQPVQDVQPRHEVWEDIVPEEQEDLPVASDGTEPARNSDPFGFFAVERELKAERDARVGSSKEAGEREAGGLILVPATSPLKLDLSVAVEADDEGEEMISPCATPPTPHKKKRKRRISALGEGEEQEELLFSPRTESLPSSPSPLKVRESWVKDYATQDRSDFVRSTTGHSDGVREEESKKEGKGKEVEEDGNETVTETTHRVLRSRAKGKQMEESTPLPLKKTRDKRRKDSQTPSDPLEFAQRLVDRLPKRRRKRAKKDEAPDEVPKPRQSARKRKTRSKKASDEKPTQVKKEVSKEQAAMRDYFKELERYSLEEEKVSSFKAVTFSDAFLHLLSRRHLRLTLRPMNPSPPPPRVQRGFEPENEGYITPREKSPYLAALLRYTSALNAMDFDTVTEVFDPKLVHSILPSSLQRPVLGYDQYLGYLDDITEMITEFRVSIHEVIEENHKMTFQGITAWKGRSQRSFNSEVVLIIHFDKISSRDLRKYGTDGGNWPSDALPKMVNVKEFVDSLSTKAWFKEERQWIKENQQLVAEQRMQRRGEWKKDRWRKMRSLSQGGHPGVLGQPTQMAHGSSSSSGYTYGYPSPFPAQGISSSRSQGQGQGQGHSPTSTRGYGSISTSLGAQGQAYSYTRSSQGYPSSYNPYTRDKYSGV